MFRKEPPAPPEIKLIYIHIYKCGGSSMRSYIKEHLVDSNTTYIDHWAYLWEADVVPPDRLLGNVLRSEELRLGPLRNPSGSTVVATHSFFYEWMKRLDGFSFATMLRDPIRRVVSQFDFEQRMFDRHKDQSVVEFIDGISSYEFNLQTAALSGSPRMDVGPIDLEKAKANLHVFDAIGFVESFDESLRLFNKIFGIESSAVAPTENVSPEGSVVPEWLVDLLQERCSYDIELYEYAQRLYRGKVAALELLATDDRESTPPSLRG
jgi:hypothetical protein